MKIQLRIGYVALLFAVIVALFANCKSTKTATEHIPEQQVEVEKILPLDFDFNTLSRNFTAKVEGLNITLNGQVRIKHDSVIWLTLSKVVEIGRAKLTQDSVFVFLKIQNKYFAGSYVDLAKTVGMDFNYQAVQAMLLGNEMEIYNLTNQTPIISGNMARYNLEYAEPGGAIVKQTIVLNTDNKKIVANMVNIQNNVSFQLKYSAFETISGSNLATKIDVSFANRTTKANIGITFGKTLVNQDVTFPYKVPNKAKPLQF